MEDYHYFMNEIGFAGAHRHVCNIVDQNRDKYERIFIIGFSVGATLAWMKSGHGVDGIVGFYGSRIRDYTEIEPACASLLFFAKHEKSFNALDLQQKLRDKQNAHVEMIDAEHGFMNPYHDACNFNEYHQCLKRCKDFLKQIAG
jgi:dienelactone hydrolase